MKQKIDRREKLRLQMTELMHQTSVLRGKIQVIDDRRRSKEIEKIVGRCFHTEYEWVWITGYDYKRGDYQSIKITQYGADHFEISMNGHVFESQLRDQKTRKISRLEFNRKFRYGIARLKAVWNKQGA